MQEKIYTTFQIADICGVRPTTIIKWVNQKKIRAYVTPGGHRRIRHSDLMSFLREYNFPIPDELTGSRRKVLIVEDDASIGQLLKKVFQKASDQWEVEWIKDGIEALLVLGKNPPDVVVLDVVMPVVDGARVLATLRSDERTKGVKVIGVTGKRLAPDKLKFMQQHTDAFYFKPFDVNDLVRKAIDLLSMPIPSSFASAGTRTG